MKEAEESRKLGQVLITDEITATFRYGFQTLNFVLYPEAGIRSTFKLSIPIPFMKKSHGVQYLMFTSFFKKWRLF